MSQSILDMLSGQLGGRALEMIGSQLGADRSQVEKAMPTALGSLMSGLARNAQSADGASALASALSKDHDGSILDNLSGALSGSGQSAGASGGHGGAGIVLAAGPRGRSHDPWGEVGKKALCGKSACTV